MRALSDILEPLIAEFQGILIQSAGTEDIHLQMIPFLAALFCNRQHGVAVEILLSERSLDDVLALGIYP